VVEGIPPSIFIPITAGMKIHVEPFQRHVRFPTVKVSPIVGELGKSIAMSVSDRYPGLCGFIPSVPLAVGGVRDGCVPEAGVFVQ
jgi:hypothetical protein